jgi:hypothetical protein
VQNDELLVEDFPTGIACPTWVIVGESEGIPISWTRFPVPHPNNCLCQCYVQVRNTNPEFSKP